MMSEQEFDARRVQIKEQSEARKEAAVAWGDQEMARLYLECAWGQERIARHLGMKQQHVSRRLIFGEFLKFTPAGVNTANLTEWRFRQHWQRTEGKDRERFAVIAGWLEHGIPHGMEAIEGKPGIGRAINRAVSEPGIMNEREYDLLTAAPALPKGANRDRLGSLPGSNTNNVSKDKATWLRSIRQGDPFVRGLFVSKLIDLKLAVRQSSDAALPFAGVRASGPPGGAEMRLVSLCPAVEAVHPLPQLSPLGRGEGQHGTPGTVQRRGNLPRRVRLLAVGETHRGGHALELAVGQPLRRLRAVPLQPGDLAFRAVALRQRCRFSIFLHR
jgi:hypothetical protein